MELQTNNGFQANVKQFAALTTAADIQVLGNNVKLHIGLSGDFVEGGELERVFNLSLSYFCVMVLKASIIFQKLRHFFRTSHLHVPMERE